MSSYIKITSAQKERLYRHLECSQSVKSFLIFISNHCYTQSTKFEYAKESLESKRYHKGQLSAIRYIEQLSIHYFKKEKILKKEFIDTLYNQLEKVAILEESDYTQGIYDAINALLTQLINEQEFSEVATKYKSFM